MTSTYSLRSHAVGSQAPITRSQSMRKSPLEQKKTKDSDPLETQGLLSPTLFRKFQELATATPKKYKTKQTSSKVSGSSKKRANTRRVLNKSPKGGANIRKIVPSRQTETSTDLPFLESPEVDLLEKSTDNSTSDARLSETALEELLNPGQDFTIWEEPSDGEEMDKEVQPVEEATIEEKGSNKENDVGSDTSPGPMDETISFHNNATDRCPLVDVTSKALAEYSDVVGQCYKISYSPNAFFKKMPGSGSPFKYPCSPVPYGKNMPPPSQLTRTAGSEHYRVNTINLFGKRPQLKVLLDSMSPTTPARVPTHMHTSKLSRRLFPSGRVSTDGSNLDTRKNEESPVKAAIKKLSRHSTPFVKTEKHKSPQTCPSYQLRPRPTPKPLHIRLETFVPTPSALDSPRGTSFLGDTKVSKKKKKVETRSQK